MRVLIQALSQVGGSHLCRAGRFFPTTEPLEVEVLDQEHDPPPIEVMVPNGTTGRLQKETRPDPVRMGKASYALVKADRRMRIVEEAGVNSAVADAQVQAARGEVQRISGELSDARVEIATLKAEVERLTGELDEATKPKPNSATAATPTVETKGRAPSQPTVVTPAAATETVVGPVTAGTKSAAMPLPAATIQPGAPPPADATKGTPSA